MTASRRGLVLVLVLALVWGSNFLWIKVALDGLSPVQLTFARMAAGALVLALVVRLRSERPPTDRTFVAHITIAALVGNVLPYLLFAVGEQSVDSAMAGVLNATTPLWTVLVALAAGQERRPRPVRVLGLVIGFTGALLIAEPWSADSSSIGGELACLAAAASYGVSYVYMARYLTPRALSPFVLAYGQMIAATTLLTPAVLVFGRQEVNLTADVLTATVVLGLAGTGLAYVINYALIARDGATVASTVTYLLPVVAVLLGALVLNEAITGTMVVGTLVVLLGVTLARRAGPATDRRIPHGGASAMNINSGNETAPAEQHMRLVELHAHDVRLLATETLTLLTMLVDVCRGTPVEDEANTLASWLCFRRAVEQLQVAHMAAVLGHYSEIALLARAVYESAGLGRKLALEPNGAIRWLEEGTWHPDREVREWIREHRDDDDAGREYYKHASDRAHTTLASTTPFAAELTDRSLRIADNNFDVAQAREALRGVAVTGLFAIHCLRNAIADETFIPTDLRQKIVELTGRAGAETDHLERDWQAEDERRERLLSRVQDPEGLDQRLAEDPNSVDRLRRADDEAGG